MTDSLDADFGLPQTTSQPHSRLGVASFVLGMVGNCLIWGTGIVLAGLGVAVSQGMDDGKMEPAFMAGGFVALGGFVCNLVGVPLGIAGLFQKERRLLYAIIGLGICAVTVIGWPLMAALTLAMTAPAQ